MSVGDESELDRLVREGVVTLPEAPRRPLPEPIVARGTVSDLVTEQRR